MPFSVKIFATDVSPNFIQKAKRGRYTYQEVTQIPPDFLNKYFIKCADCYEIIPEIKQQILFITHNLLVDPPFTKLDLICCRNLMIYIKSQEQKRVLDLLRFSLKVGGFLFLGPSEGPSSLKPELTVISQAWKIFKKTKHSNFPQISTNINPKPFIQGSYSQSARTSSAESLPIYAYNAILREAVSSGFVIDTSYEILHSIGQARDFLILPEGAPTLVLTKLIVDELKGVLIVALHQAKIKLTPVVYDNVDISRANNKHQTLKMTVHPICDKNHKISYYWIRLDPETETIKKQTVITISDSQKQMHHDESIIALEEELSEARVLLQSTLENMETVNEEMQSTNEELMASNEELQSANEELRSVNEKMNAVNLEREKRIEEVVQAKDDIDNLIRSAEICTIILNAKLEIRIFTPGIKKIFNLMEHDIGRSLENFQHNLNFDFFVSKASEVLKTNSPFESEIKNNNNQWYLLKITPYYASQSQVITGIVVAFTDISYTKLLQQEKEKIEKNLRLALKTGVIGIWHCDVQTHAFHYDDTIMNMYGLHNHVTMNQLSNFIEAIHLDDRKRIEAALESTIDKQEDFEQNFRIYRPDGGIRYISCSANSHENITDSSKFLTGICWDITEKYWLEEKIIDAEHLNLGLDAITDGWWDWDIVRNEVYLSPLLKRTFGYQDHELPNRMDSYEQLMLPEDLKTIRQNMKAYMKSNSDYPLIQELRFKHKSGEIVWVLLRRKGILDRHKKLVRMIGTLTKITDLKETEISLEKMAYRDFMTKVPNKPAFSDALLRAIARGKRKQSVFSVLYVDIDNFKVVNDKWGHDFGDKVLCEVVNKLMSVSRTVDFLARLGGDEFGILIEDLINQQEITSIANRYLLAFSDPLLIDTRSVHITLSIGVALYPEHGETYQALLQHADQAMYRAKKLGKNQVSL